MVNEEQIRAEYELEQKRNARAVDPEDIPVSYEAITPEWLTHFICKGRPSAKVTGYRLDKADDGITNRRRIFLTFNQAGERVNLPESVFCKSSQKLANRLIMAKCGHIVGEVLFYSRYVKKLDIEASTCFLATFDGRSYNSIIILDDLARLGAQFCSYKTEMTKERARSQMELLAKLHGRYYGSADLDTAALMTFERTFQIKDELLNVEECSDVGILAAESFIPASLFSRRKELWRTAQQAIALHAQYPRTLTHGDPHFANWYISHSDNMALCDWQCLAKGHWGRDVAYTITSSLSVENRRAWEEELIRFYLEALREAGGPAIAFAEGWDLYRKHSLAALLVWTLTLGFSVKSYLEAAEFHSQAQIHEFVKRIATAVDDLGALNSFR